MICDFIQNKAISWEYNVVLQLNGVSDLPEIDHSIYKVILFTKTLLLVEFGKLTVWDMPSSLYLLVSDNMEALFIWLLPRLEIPTPWPAESF